MRRLKKGQKGLHVACGGNVLPGWTNIDNNPQVQGVVSCDVMDMRQFGAGTFDRVLCEMMIEHLAMEHVPTALMQMFRVLKDGGQLELSTVNFEGCINFYRDYIDSVLIGDDDNLKAWNRFMELNNHLTGNELKPDVVWHKSIHAPWVMKVLLANEGFTNIKFADEDGGMSFRVTARKSAGRPYTTKQKADK